jgi:excisionase family DNA binding protein
VTSALDRQSSDRTINHPGRTKPRKRLEEGMMNKEVEEAPSSELLTVSQAAVVMGMSTRYVRRLVAERRIAFHRLGRSVRIAAGDVQAHVVSGRVEPMTESDVWSGMRRVG